MIPYSRQSISQHDIDEVVRVLKSSHLTQGDEVALFEDAICEYIGCSHAITFNSATSALLAAYMACDIVEGDEIITTPISFVATANMFVALGAKPIWCDVKQDGNIDETKIEALITSKTKAIVPVAFAGKPVEIKKIVEIANKHNLHVIEDASHAFGSSTDGQKVGTFAPLNIFSFHAIKPLTTGEGGAITTNDATLAKKLKLIRSHGIEKKQHWNSDMLTLGYNYRLTEFAAALGRSQIKMLDNSIAKREEIAQYYDERLSENKFFTIDKLSKEIQSSRHLYPILLNKKLHPFKEEIFETLHKQGIGVQVHYKPIYQNSFYREKFGMTCQEVAEDFYNSELSIPCHQLMSLEDAQHVIDILLDTLKAYSLKVNNV